MSRNYVSKMLVGTGIANQSAAAVALAALTEGQIIAFDFDKANTANTAISSGTTHIGFARGTAVLGEPILAGPIPVSGIREALNNPYQAPVGQTASLTVEGTPDVGTTVIFKVVYHDNLSIIPNQIKNTTVSVIATYDNIVSSEAWAAAIAAEFNKQKGGNLFVDVSAAAGVVSFQSIILKTQSNYNGIDRPEAVAYEVAYPGNSSAKSSVETYKVATTKVAKTGQGDPSKIAWLEEQHMGRLGYADRRMWNNTKKYQSQLVSGISEYETLVINADQFTEGDMQGVRANPVGVVIATSEAGMGALEADLAVCSIVPVVIPANA